MEQQWNRIQGVKMVRNGIPVAEVARFFSVSTRAVFGWVATFAGSSSFRVEVAKLGQMAWGVSPP